MRDELRHRTISLPPLILFTLIAPTVSTEIGVKRNLERRMEQTSHQLLISVRFFIGDNKNIANLEE
jgi:hypothetical protein